MAVHGTVAIASLMGSFGRSFDWLIYFCFPADFWFHRSLMFRILKLKMVVEIGGSVDWNAANLFDMKKTVG